MDRITNATSSTATTNTSSPAPLFNPSQMHPDLRNYLVRLDSWKVTEANGQLVVNTILQWLNKGNVDDVLNLSELGMHSLPPLPGNLKCLKADKNHLTQIPENHLPVTLEALDVHCNQLTSLPDSLPIAQLKLLNAAKNKLNALPFAALNLDPACKVFFAGNNLSSDMLFGQFGPEQNHVGMRRRSTAGEFLANQAEAVKTLATAVAAWMPADHRGVRFCTQDVQGMTSFADFLNQMQVAPFVRDEKLVDATVQAINKISADPDLCKTVFEHTKQARDQCYFQLAFLHHQIQRCIIISDIENGQYNGRLSDLVGFTRQRLRSEAIFRVGSLWLRQEFWNSKTQLNAIWGELALSLNSTIKLDIDIKLTRDRDRISSFNVIHLAYVIPNLIKHLENMEFPAYFCDRKSRFAHLLKIVDPQIGEIMDNELDANGNHLHGTELTKLHIEQINQYFARMGKPDLLGQVWPAIENLPPEVYSLVKLIKFDRKD